MRVPCRNKSEKQNFAEKIDEIGQGRGTGSRGTKTGEHMKPNAMFTTLKENKDFRRLYHRGKSYVSPVLVTYVMKNRKAGLRIGFTTSKKIGIAVQRNRSRRIMREAFRLIAPELKTGYDFVFVARGKTPFVKCEAVKRAMTKQLKEAGVFK